MQHEDEYREALTLEALDTLGGEERRALGAHLSGCAACRAELDELREAAALLAHEAAAVSPPAALRARVLERVKALPAAAGADKEAAAEDGTEAAEELAAGGAARPTVRPFRPRAPGRTAAVGSAGWLPTRAFAFGAVAASLVITALAVVAALLWRQNQELRGQLAQLSEIQETWRAEMAREREVSDILSAPGARVAHLKGTQAADRARASLVYDPATGRALLLANGLPLTPEGKAYQLWYVAAGKPLPGGLFKTDDAGRASLRDRVPAEGRDASLFAVTLEPAAGATAPTGDKFLIGPPS